MITCTINATPFNDARTSTHERDAHAFEQLQSFIANLIDDHVRDEMHDANECDITFKIHLRNNNDTTQMIITHDIEYETIRDINSIDQQLIIARYD